MERIRSWGVSSMNYGAGIRKWNHNELQTDRKTRKIMTMNKLLHHRSDAAWLRVSKNNGGRRLIAKKKKNKVKSEEDSPGR